MSLEQGAHGNIQIDSESTEHDSLSHELDVSDVGAVIFDLDGVVADSLNAGHKPAWVIFASWMGYKLTEEVKHLIDTGRRNDEILPALVGRALSSEELAELAALKESIYLEWYRPTEIEGLTEFLDQLQARGIRLAIATSAPKEGRDLLLRGLGIEGRFDVIIGEEDVAKGKPDPEVYMKAAEKLGIPAGKCIAFEDTPSGILSARNAGLKGVVGITSSYEQLEGTLFMTDTFRNINLIGTPYVQ